MSSEACTIDHFLLEASEEALGWSVVPAIATAAHAARDSGLLKCLLVVTAGILTTPIGVTYQVPIVITL